MTSLPELREGEAPPEIAAIYEDIRRATQLPLVNLVYRHLATLPGALPYVWGLVRPAITAGALDEALERIVAGIPLPELSPPVPRAGSGTDFSAADADAVVMLLESYNRGNLLNLVSLSAARLVLDQSDRRARPGDFAHARPRAAAREPVPAIPPLPKLQELPAETAALVQALAALHGGAAAAGVVPSLYLHLAHWPEFLSKIHGPVQLFVEEGGLARARARLLDLVEVEARELAPAMAIDLPPPAPEDAARLLAVLTTFTRQIIPEMVPIGLLLRRAGTTRALRRGPT